MYIYSNTYTQVKMERVPIAFLQIFQNERLINAQSYVEDFFTAKTNILMKLHNAQMKTAMYCLVFVISCLKVCRMHASPIKTLKLQNVGLKLDHKIGAVGACDAGITVGLGALCMAFIYGLIKIHVTPFEMRCVIMQGRGGPGFVMAEVPQMY